MSLAELSVAAGPMVMEPTAAERLVSDLLNPKALEAYRPFKADGGERLGVRDGVAILYVNGPLFHRDSWLTKVLGATTYAMLRRDLQAALDHADIKAIALRIDSPGGEANGCSEMAAAIYEARSKKPIHAYVSGMAASGGYWLAAAAERVVVSDAAILGSIGVTISVQDTRKRDASRGIERIEFVSSQSPGKRPDIATDGGRARIQRMVDDMAEVFVSAVAKYRRVTPQTVIEKFGNGGVEVGANAVKAGMADEVGNFEAMLKTLSKKPVPIYVRPLSAAKEKPAGLAAMAPMTAAQPPQLTAAEQAAANAKARAEAEAVTRIRTITSSPEGLANPDRAAELALDTTIPASVAIATLKQEAISASWKKAADHVNHIRRY